MTPGWSFTVTKVAVDLASVVADHHCVAANDRVHGGQPPRCWDSTTTRLVINCLANVVNLVDDGT
jgi:hypothetical protein